MGQANAVGLTCIKDSFFPVDLCVFCLEEKEEKKAKEHEEQQQQQPKRVLASCSLHLIVLTFISCTVYYNFAFTCLAFTCLAFSALMMLVGCQEGHTDEVLAWLPSGAKCK